MASTTQIKTYMRMYTADAICKLRTRLSEAMGEHITQPRLAEIVGEMTGNRTSGITVYRWEHGALTPHPATREKLAQIAIEHGWIDIASALTDIPMDDFLGYVEQNVPKGYEAMIAAAICATNEHVFEPEDPDNPSADEAEVANRYEALRNSVRDLARWLAARSRAGSEMILIPPGEHYRVFWQRLLKETDSHGKA